MADNVENVGNIFIVDPNPPNLEVIPPEDMFIYVKFSAYPRNRTTYQGADKQGNDQFSVFGVEDEVNFISTEIRYNSDGKIDPKLQKTYSTTNWSNIGNFSNSQSSGILEGFGIKSIDIKYNASLVPTVDITFTDVRGSALFDNLPSNGDIKSPYAVFFKLPYPIFRLSVKGYYGQKVDYCLHMVNWTSSFDNTTGNFDISANFLGYQQAILNDMVLGNVIGVVNTDTGFEKLQNIFNKGNNNSNTNNSTTINTLKLDDFLVKISKLQIESQVIKSKSDSFNVLKDLNGKLSLLKQIRTFIGSPIEKDVGGQNNPDDTQKNYLKIPNDKTKIVSSSINDNILKPRVNYQSIRDYLLIKTINQSNFKTYISTLNVIINQYNKYISSDDRFTKTNDNSLTSAKDKKTNSSKPIKTSKDNQLILSFKNTNDEDNWEGFVVTKENKKIITDDRSSLVNILTKFSSNDDVLSLTKNYDDGDVNKNFSIENFKNTINTKEYYNDNFTPETVVMVVDFREQRVLVEDSIKDLESTIKKQREKVEEEINVELVENFKKETGFNPTIKSCFEILANNTQAMIETISDITVKSEEEGIIKDRGNILKNYSTDIPNSIQEKINNSTSTKGVAWPSIYIENGNSSEEEIYIGEVNNVNRSVFPEYDFVENVFDKLVNKKENLREITRASILRNGLDSDNWFPINPIDYDINPFINFNVGNDKDTIKNELYKTIITRLMLLKNYSRFKDPFISKLNSYGKLDGLMVDNIVIGNQTRLLIENILKVFTDSSNNTEIGKILSDIKFNKSINISNTYITLKDNSFDFDGVKIGGDYDNESNDYVLFNNKGVTTNTKNLLQSIIDSDVYSNKKNSPGSTSDKISTEYDSTNNIVTNNLINVFKDSVSNTLLKDNTKLSLDILKNLTYESIEPHINKTEFKTIGTTEYEENLVKGLFYRNQPSNLSRGLLCLSTLPFEIFKTGFIDPVFEGNNFNNSRIVKLPSLYVYYIGGLLWRLEENVTGSINFGTFNGVSYDSFRTDKNKYFTKFGYLTGNNDISIEDNLTSLPKSVKIEFINQFKNWVSGNFNKDFTGIFEGNLFIISEGVDEKKIQSSKKIILDQVKDTTDFIILDPNIFNPTKENNNLSITFDDINKYIGGLYSVLNSETETVNTNSNSQNEEKKEKNNLKIKLQLYNYFKNINDKWISDTEKPFNICGGQGRDLIDYFKFIDRGWNDIGSKAVFNLKSFLSLGSDLNVSLYFFMSKLLRDSNFLLQILPNYINYKDVEEVSKIFKPQTTIESNVSSAPIYCCIYAGGNSQVLDIGERNNYYFKDDGFTFKNGSLIPPDMVDDSNPVKDITNSNFSLVAFRVAFGAQNQTIFKSVSLNQQEHKETAEYFRTLSDLVDKRGSTQRTYQGTNLLRLFKTRSYTCQVESLGCMNIQPLMYFDLQNVPFFNGAYLITNVNHSISPNHMTTSFQGLRQSKFITPPIEDITTSLDIDLNESSEIPKIVFTNLKSGNPIFSIGVNDPDKDFDFDNNFTEVNFKSLGVSETLKLTNLKEVMKNQELTTNSQVTMFLTNVLVQSNNLVEKELPWNIVGEVPNKISNTNNNLYYGDITRSDNVLPIYTASTKETNSIVTDTPVEEYLTIQPIFSSSTSTSDDLSFTPNDNHNLSQDKYFNILDGDEYRYRPRGYLYIIGRKQYKDLVINGLSKPDQITSSQDSLFTNSIKVWKEIKDSVDMSCFDYVSKSDGNGAVLSKTVEICQQLNTDGKTIQKSFEVFEKVLNTFTYKKDDSNVPLINYFNP